MRRHMTPSGFEKATLAEVRRYAEVFGVPVANLFQVLAAGDGARVVQEKTPSPWTTVTRAETEDA